MTTEQIVYIVDDDAAVRDSLYELLLSEGIAARVYPSAATFLDECNPAMHGCAIFDIRMPEITGMELLQHPKVLDIELPVILITAYSDVPLAVQAMKFGAIDFIEKPIHSELLLQCIRRSFSDQQQHQLRSRQRFESTQRLGRLTAREREVVDLLIAGKSSREIASDLDISPRTVEVHRATVKNKLGTKSLSDIVRMVLLQQAKI